MKCICVLKTKYYVFAWYLVKNTSHKAFRGSGGGAPRKKIAFMGRNYSQKCIQSIWEILKNLHKNMMKSQKISY